jgi:hypothetical protein
MSATLENQTGTGRPVLYDLIADVCETFPRIGPGERLAPEEYRRLEDVRTKAAEALEELVGQMRSISMTLGMVLEGGLLLDSQNAADCVYLLQNLSDITAALREVETDAATHLRWSDQGGRPPGREGQDRANDR